MSETKRQALNLLREAYDQIQRFLADGVQIDIRFRAHPLIGDKLRERLRSNWDAGESLSQRIEAFLEEVSE